MIKEGQIRIPSGCAISGVIARDGTPINGQDIINSIATMHERSNGLGGGFAGYGIYPQYADYYALHLFYDDAQARAECEAYLDQYFEILNLSKIPVRKTKGITDASLIWRYFVTPLPNRLAESHYDEQGYVVRRVLRVNAKIGGAYVFSCGKNMGVGYPEDIGAFFRLEEYEGYCWTAHGRYPTNTPGWWGGAHPFALLDCSVVHNGEISSYDRLLVTTGSRPAKPPIPGLDTVAKKFTFLTLDDALGLQATLTPESRVLILGAGLIGLKCAEGIYPSVQQVTVVDMAEHILPSVLDGEAATRMQAHLENAGIIFRLGQTVQEFEGNAAKLSGGGEEAFDVLVVAVGVVPNAEMVKDAGGAVERGIVVDENGETSLADVYAAGDCAQCTDITTGESRVLAILPNAYHRGLPRVRPWQAVHTPSTRLWR